MSAQKQQKLYHMLSLIKNWKMREKLNWKLPCGGFCKGLVGFVGYKYLQTGQAQVCCYFSIKCCEICPARDEWLFCSTFAFFMNGRFKKFISVHKFPQKITKPRNILST